MTRKCCTPQETCVVYYSKQIRLGWGLNSRRVWGAHILLKQDLAKWHERGTKDGGNEFRLLLQNADCCRIQLLVRDKHVMQRTVCSCCTFHCVTKQFRPLEKFILNKRWLLGYEKPVIRSLYSVEFEKVNVKMRLQVRRTLPKFETHHFRGITAQLRCKYEREVRKMHCAFRKKIR